MPRATPLPPDERRAALIAATGPLLAEFGREVSTRQIAEAASVAEGTIFRAFGTKEALIDAAVEDVFDPAHTCAALAVIPVTLHLEDRLVAAVMVLQASLRQMFAIFHAMRMRPLGRDHDHVEDRRRHEEQLNAAVAALLEPDRARLRMTPAEAAVVLRMVAFSLTHPLLGNPELAQPERIVDLVLHGITQNGTSTERTSC